MIKKYIYKIITVIIAVMMIFTLIPSSPAYAADLKYDYQPADAEANGKQSVKLLKPSDISVIEETGDYFLNQINTVVDGTEDIVFSLSMTSGINNFSEDNFLNNNMPVIKIYDSDYNVVAEFSNGAGDLKFKGSLLTDEINNQGTNKTREVYIGVDEGVLGTGDYILEFGKEFCGNNTSKRLDKDVRFKFTVNALAELEDLIVTAKTLLDNAKIGTEVGQYPQEAAEIFLQKISEAEKELDSINSELADGKLTGEEAEVRKVTAAEILDAAVSIFKNSRIVYVERIEIEGIGTTQYVGDAGYTTARVVAYPNEDSYKRVTWEASENINIDAVSGAWLAVYAGEGWVRAVSKTDGSVEAEVDVNVTHEDGVASYVYGSGVPMSTALGENLAGITSLKLFTTNGYTFTKNDADEIQNVFTGLKCLDLKRVELESIGSNWFKNWGTIEQIILPHDLKEIGVMAFYNCTGLRLITFPAALEKIGESAFAGCTSLDSTLEVMAANPPVFETEDNDRLKLGDSFNGYGTDEEASITSIKVPFGSKETYLNDEAWSRYDIIETEEKRLTVEFSNPGNLAVEAERALAEKGWEDQEVSTLIINSPDDVYLEKTTDVKYLKNNFLGVTDLDLTGTRFNGTNLQSSTFEGRRNVREIKLPADITHIGKKVFYGCTNMRTLTIPEGVSYRDSSSPGIGENALSQCDRLETLIFLPGEPPGYDGSLPTGLEVVYVPNLSVADYQEEFSEMREIIKPMVSVTVADTSVEAMKTKTLKATVDSVVPVEGLKWEIVGQNADNPVAVINENTGVLTACRYGIVKVKVTADYGTMNECSDTCTVTVTKAPAVTLSGAAASFNSADLSWTAMSGAEGYQIFRAASKDGEYSLHKTVSASTKSYTDTGLATGKTYYYKVRGYKTVNGVKVYGEYSSAVAVKTSLNVPSGVAAARKSYNSINVSWKAVSGANGYKVYRATSANGTYSEIVSTDSSTLTYTDTGRTVGKTYYYKVCAYRNIDNSKVYSAKSDAVSVKTYLTAPTTSAKRNSYNSIKVSWNGISGAIGYKIYRATSKSGKYSLIATKGKDVRSYVDTKRTTGKTYYYKVRAYRTINDSPVYSAYSAVKSAVPTLSKVSTVKTAKAGTRKIKVTWSSVSGATGYKVYRSTKKTSGFKVVKTVKAGKTRAYTSGKLTKNKKYYFKVRAYRVVNGKAVYGPYSYVVYRTAK